MTQVALICGSRKPAPGATERSAAREMLREVARGVDATGHESTWIDLRRVELPWWDGRTGEDYGSADLDRLASDLEACSVAVISAPAYWNGLSGPVKNLFDLLGPAPWRDTTVAGLIVGMNASSAYAGEDQLRQVVSAVGAWWAPHSMVIGNPRDHTDVPALRRDLRRFGGYAGLLAGRTAVETP
ncbi:NADPH-dependent FMN reductase [Nocardiopsis salina]|uniref:NADPH-dependent FMN reductase n=1 Tax=Nocardiopsis salina TaxID=245836 RepID=UPI000347EF0D|nr:NAD(P)H-dependent oxidoreductase [Nocardiopsis salina]